MTRTAYAGTLAIVFLVSLLAAPQAGAQGSPPDTLLVTESLHLMADGLANETQWTSDGANETAEVCAAIGAGAGAVGATYSGDVVLAPGSYYLAGGKIDVNLDLSRPDDTSAQATTGTGGVEITGSLTWGESSVDASPTMLQPGRTDVDATTLSFSVDGSSPNATTEPLTLSVTLRAVEAGGALPGAGAELAIVCNVDASNFDVSYVLGQVGDGDIDGDGIPDSEDDDRDGDGVPDDQEDIDCEFDGQTVNFADDPALMPGEESDGDGDGYTDEEECEAGVSPKSAAAVPPQPAGIPWVLIIVLLVILILIVAIIYVVLKYGRVVDVEVVTQPELIIDPGKTGKFEVAVESRKNKGDAVTVQLAVDGMPDGWDAKTDVDHVSVEPQGEEDSRKTFFLTVEAPEHDDPESAEVTVKAVPLNKQGRKDTFRLATTVATITSINVPPDAKVPVKRGGPIKLKSPEDEAGPAAMGIPPEGLPVSDLPDIKDAQVKKLNAADVETTEQLRTADLDELAEKTKLDAELLQRWQSVSDLIRVPGISPEHGDALAKSGVGSTKDLADLSPDDLVERINAHSGAEEAA